MEELVRLGDTRQRIEYLERLPELVEEYLRDLPELVRGVGLEVREYETVPEERTEANPLRVYTLTPEAIRERTSGELEEIRRKQQQARGERLFALYEVLGFVGGGPS